METTELKKFKIFSTLSDSVLAKILKTVDIKNISQGEVICKENSVSDIFYLIKSGNVEIYKHTAQGDTKVLAILSEGSHFGEMSLFHDSLRMASVKAATDVRLFEIKRESFIRLMSEDIETGMKLLSAIMSIVLNRLSSTNSHLTLLYDIGKTIAAAKNLKQMIQSVFLKVQPLFLEKDKGLIAVCNQFTDELDILASEGIASGTSAVPRSDELAVSIKFRKELLVADVEKEMPELCRHFAVGSSFIASAFYFEDNFLGFMMFSAPVKNAFSLNDLMLLSSVASLMSVSINNISFIQEEEARKRLEKTRFRQGF